ncbi:helix-turn-helix domain-containing protein [Chryseobacterium sp. Mn2064]|uniref:helix-turn-helix domain-containing protein n=1 Tax=Chryseobacterium sp. Mn2064 TaxID=3395263 RepID=UPI003BD7A23A
MITKRKNGLENSLNISNNDFNVSERSDKYLEQCKLNKGLLTREETAKFFHVDLSTLHNWKKKGILMPVGIGGRVYYRMCDINKALTPLN